MLPSAGEFGGYKNSLFVIHVWLLRCFASRKNVPCPCSAIPRQRFAAAIGTATTLVGVWSRISTAVSCTPMDSIFLCQHRNAFLLLWTALLRGTGTVPQRPMPNLLGSWWLASIRWPWIVSRRG